MNLHSAAIATIIKLTYIESYGKTGDFLWDSRNLTYWCVTETNVGILATVSRDSSCIQELMATFKDDVLVNSL